METGEVGVSVVDRPDREAPSLRTMRLRGIVAYRVPTGRRERARRRRGICLMEAGSAAVRGAAPDRSGDRPGEGEKSGKGQGLMKGIDRDGGFFIVLGVDFR